MVASFLVAFVWFWVGRDILLPMYQWQVAVKELYVITEFMRLLGIQHRALLDKKLFFLRDLSQIGT